MGKNVASLVIIVALVVCVPGLSLSATDASTEDCGAKFSASPLGRVIMGHIGRMLVLRSELNLTGEQRKNIAAEIKSHKDEIRPAAKEVFEKRKALREAVMDKPGDEKAIMAAANDLGKAIGNAAVLASKITAKVKPILTPEQQELVKNFTTSSDKAIGNWIDQIGK